MYVLNKVHASIDVHPSLWLIYGIYGVSQHALRQTLPPVDRMMDRCKKNNLRKLHLRAVMKHKGKN